MNKLIFISGAKFLDGLWRLLKYVFLNESEEQTTTEAGIINGPTNAIAEHPIKVSNKHYYQNAKHNKFKFTEEAKIWKPIHNISVGTEMNLSSSLLKAHFIGPEEHSVLPTNRYKIESYRIIRIVNKSESVFVRVCNSKLIIPTLLRN